MPSSPFSFKRLIFVWIPVGLFALAVPSALSALAQKVILGEVQSGIGWFALGGQFGDQFGVLTCLSAIAAAYFTYQTLSRQREAMTIQERENEDAKKAQRTLLERQTDHYKLIEEDNNTARIERTFFKLHDDTKEALNRFRSGMEIPGVTKSQNEIPAMTAMIQDLVRSRGFDKMTQEQKERELIGEMRVCKYMSHFTLSEVVHKFDLALRYLDLCRERNSSAINDGAHLSLQLYYEVLVSTFYEQEIRAVCLLYLEFYGGVFANDQDAFSFSMRILNLFLKRTLNLEAKREEVPYLLASPARPMADSISLIRASGTLTA